MGRVIMVTSGKGGTGKTTLTANLGAALALRGKSAVVVDMDMGLRNLDVALGLESSIVYDVADIIENTCTLDDALIKHQKFDSLFFIPAPQTRDASVIGASLTEYDDIDEAAPVITEEIKIDESSEEELTETPANDEVSRTDNDTALNDEHTPKKKHRLGKHKTIEKHIENTVADVPVQEQETTKQTKDKNELLAEIWKQFWERLAERFDYVIIDSPAGIDGGFKYAAYGADEAIVVTLAETAALRDADRVIDVLEDAGIENVRLVINRIRPDMISKGIMMNIDTCIDMLGIPILGIVGDDIELISASLKSELAVNTEKSSAGTAFKNIAARVMGERVAIMSFEKKKSIWEVLRSIFKTT